MEMWEQWPFLLPPDVGILLEWLIIGVVLIQGIISQPAGRGELMDTNPAS